MIVYFVVKDLKMKFFFHYIKKGPLDFGSISSGKVYYELVPIFIVLTEIDFVKKNRNVILLIMYLVLFTHDCEVFWLKTLAEPCTVYYQKTCCLLCNIVLMKFSDMHIPEIFLGYGRFVF